jgi:hypothetical protein
MEVGMANEKSYGDGACPTCLGLGFIFQMQNKDRGVNPRPNPPSCPECNGTGRAKRSVPAEQTVWVDRSLAESRLAQNPARLRRGFLVWPLFKSGEAESDAMQKVADNWSGDDNK